MKLDDFICDKCGECCKHIDLIPELKKFNNNGSCRFLDNNLCTIYNIRPSSCNRFLLFEKYKDFMTEEEFVDAIYYYCKKLKEISFLDKGERHEKIF